MEPTKNPPSFRKEYAMFLQKPIMVYGVWPLVLGYFVNHISSWATTAGTRTSGVIPFLPYMVFSVVMCVISWVWWCLRLQRHQRLSQGIQMTQAVQSYTISVSDDATLPLESGVQGRQDASEDNTIGASTRRNPHQDLQADSSILSPSSDFQYSDQNQSSERCSCRHGLAERIGGGGHEMMNGDLSKNHLSTGSSLHGVSDLAPASSSPSSSPHAIIGRNSGTQLLSSMLLITEEEDISRLAEVLRTRLREALNNPDRCFFLVNVLNNNDILELLVKMLKPRSNLRGSRILHKRIEIGQSRHWWKDFLSSEVIEYMKLAKTYDKDCTMQLGSVAVLKYTDAGLKCWMLQKDSTPVILDLHRSRRSFLHLLNDERPKWTVTGFNLEKAILRVATTERSRDLTILNYRKIDDGVEELSFQEPRTFRMFSNEVYIVASNPVQLEGVTSKLYSEATKVQGAFWISVLDSLILTLWTGFLIASLLLVGGFAFPIRHEFLTAGWFAVGFPIGYSVFLLLLREFAPLEELDVDPNHGSTISSEDRRNTSTVTPSPARRTREEEGTTSASPKLARQRKSDEGENSKIENALTGRERSFSNQYNSILHEAMGSSAAQPSENVVEGDDSSKLQILDSATEPQALKLNISNEDGALADLVNSPSVDDDLELQELGVRQSLAHELKLKTLKEDGASASLVRLVSHQSNSNLKGNAASVLRASAAGDEEGKLVISVADGTQRGSPELQEEPAGALQSLASGTDENKRQIMEVEWALHSLGIFLLKDDNPELQENAARALQNLAADEIKLQNVKKYRPRKGFKNYGLKFDFVEFEESVASPLRGLARGTNEIRLQIVKDDVILGGLVSSLFRNDNPGLQENAAGALWGLASGTDEIKLQIAKEDMALGGLVSSLFRNDNPGLQENAAGALRGLASGTDEIKLQIVKEESALEGLVRSLLRNHMPGLQVNAAGALRGLASGTDEIKLQIVKDDMALKGLVRSLFQDNKPGLQENAAGALRSLACGTDEIKLQIAKEEMALEGLVRSLFHYGKPGLQENAAGALRGLASGTDEIKLRIVKEGTALKGLVRCLSLENNPELQAIAAGALWMLATGPEELKLAMLNEDGSLHRLVSLSEDDNPELQEIAKGSLRSLGRRK